MRRGALGVRLCDRAGCAHRWPCAVHGTLAVGDYEHLGRHAGSFELANTHPEWELDMAWCKGCGYALCSCPAESAPQPTPPAHPRELFGQWYESIVRPGRWLYGFRPGLHMVVEQHERTKWLWGCKEPGGQVHWRNSATSEHDAMRAAEAWGRAQPVERAPDALPAGWHSVEGFVRGSVTRHAATGAEVITCTAGAWWWMLPGTQRSGQCRTRDEAMAAALLAAPTAPALRSGWTTDGESYFHDRVELMVCKVPDSAGWRVHGNGDRWPAGYAFGMFPSVAKAMEWAETRAVWRDPKPAPKVVPKCRLCGGTRSSDGVCRPRDAHSPWDHLFDAEPAP